MKQPLYTIYWPPAPTCRIWMPWTWHHHRRPRGRYNRP